MEPTIFAQYIKHTYAILFWFTKSWGSKHIFYNLFMIAYNIGAL